MIKCFHLCGAPASGKSSWAKTEVAKDPLNYLHINNDDLRASFNGSVFSSDYEKLITETRTFLIREGLKRNLNLIIDNVNANKRHWETACRLAKESGKDVQVIEKIFYEPLDVLLERNAKRIGNARVPDDVVRKFFKDLGGTQEKMRNPRVEVFTKRATAADRIVEPMAQDEGLPRCVIFDNDGTISLIHQGRNPYDASTADLDLPHKHVIECMKLYHDAGYKILFVSGREEKDREPTERFYQKYFPEVKYELFMRKTSDNRKDVIIKEEIFNEHIKGKYFVAGWYDDRLQVCKWVFSSGLPLFRVNDPEASF